MAPWDNFNTPEWQQFLNSTPATAIAPNPSAMQNPSAMNQTPLPAYNPGPSPAAQLQAMTAPYQQMAAQYSQPYNAFAPNSLLGRLIPQGAQGAISNGILTGSMVRPGQTIGENISNVFGGLVGANQFNRERAMQGAMLPYQMIEPQLKAEDTIVQMQERTSEIPYRQASEQYQLSRAAHLDKLYEQPNAEQQKMQLAAAMAGIPGFTGDISKLSPIQAESMGKMYDTITMRQANASMGGGYTPAKITEMLSSSDPAVAALGAKARTNYLSVTAGAAGAGAGARQDVTIPQKDIDEQVKLANSEFLGQKPMTEAQYGKAHEYDPNYLKDPDGMYKSYFQKASQDYTQSKSSYDAKVADYQSAARKNPNLKWHDFVQQSDSMGPSNGGNQGPSAPSLSGFAAWKASQQQ